MGLTETGPIPHGQIVRFLLERGLRFRNLGFCGHDLISRDSDLQCACSVVPAKKPTQQAGYVKTKQPT